jgi:hypothetical protein
MEMAKRTNDPRILPYWKVIWLEFFRNIERDIRRLLRR